MNTPYILHCHSFADLPDLRAGGYVLLYTDGADSGLETYLTAKGFAVEKSVVDANAMPHYTACAMRILPSATRLIVAMGGYVCMELGKLTARLHDLPLWCIPTDYGATACLWCYGVWTVEGAPQVLTTPAHTTILLDGVLTADRNGVQQAYQHLFGHYVALHSAIYRHRLFNEEEANPPLRRAAERIAERMRLSVEYDPTVAPAMWQCLSEAASVAEESEIHLLAMAICLYKQDKMPYNKYEMVAAVAEAAALCTAKDVPDLYLPPDRAAVLALANTLGWHPIAAPWPTVAEYRRIDWVWRDYLADCRQAIGDIAAPSKNWRRLAGNAGYGFYADLTPADVAVLLPLAAELSPAYTPLKHLYLRGTLNPMI